jgi:hypothetical protein
VRQVIPDTVEGGRDAFDLRSRKYKFLSNWGLPEVEIQTQRVRQPQRMLTLPIINPNSGTIKTKAKPQNWKAPKRPRNQMQIDAQIPDKCGSKRPQILPLTLL